MDVTCNGLAEVGRLVLSGPVCPFGRRGQRRPLPSIISFNQFLLWHDSSFFSLPLDTTDVLQSKIQSRFERKKIEEVRQRVLTLVPVLGSTLLKLRLKCKTINLSPVPKLGSGPEIEIILELGADLDE